MTSIIIIKRNGNITEVSLTGHAGSSAFGEDIVCAGLSSIAQTAALGLLSVAGINIVLKRDVKNGSMLIKLPDNLSDTEAHEAQIILQTMYLGLNDLYENYSDFIEMEVKE